MSGSVTTSIKCKKSVISRCLLRRFFIGFICASMPLTVYVNNTPVYAADPVVAFSTPEQRVIYKELLKDHRCLKCQNQNLADSNASIAGDLRREIQQQVVAGKSRAEVSDYLVARYGDFVLYRPPFKATTYALWLGPFVLLAISLVYAMRHGRDRNRKNTQNNDVGVERVSETDLNEARSLLKDD